MSVKIFLITHHRYFTESQCEESTTGKIVARRVCCLPILEFLVAHWKGDVTLISDETLLEAPVQIGEDGKRLPFHYLKNILFLYPLSWNK